MCPVRVETRGDAVDLGSISIILVRGRGVLSTRTHHACYDILEVHRPVFCLSGVVPEVQDQEVLGWVQKVATEAAGLKKEGHAV